MFLWFPTHSFGPQREVPAVSWPAKPQNLIWFSLFFTYVFHSLLSLGPIPPTNCWSWHQRNSWHRWWRSLHPPGHLSTAISPSIHDVSSVRYSVGPSPLGIAKECFSRQRILIFKIQKSARKQKLEQALSPNKLEQFRLPSIATWLRFHAHMWPEYTLCRNVYKACWQTLYYLCRLVSSGPALSKDGSNAGALCIQVGLKLFKDFLASTWIIWIAGHLWSHLLSLSILPSYW